MTPRGSGTVRVMRLATFNILHGRSAEDEQVDEQRFADAVAALDADVLGLQEVDRNQARSRHADLTAIAAEAMGAREHRFVAALSGTPGATWTAATGDAQPDAAAYGIALLSRHPVVSWSVIRLPHLKAPVPMWFSGRWRPELVCDEPRVAVVAELEGPGGRIHVATTHLSFVPWWNQHQLRTLVRGLGALPEPLVLLGDLNMGPDRAEAVTRMHSLVAGKTFPAHRPAEQLDHILVKGDLRTDGGGPVCLPLSDHCALVADIG
jgi:endonuclease/exonuclease/phosphatase family metal-dependent hydrolase